MHIVFRFTGACRTILTPSPAKSDTANLSAPMARRQAEGHTAFMFSVNLHQGPYMKVYVIEDSDAIGEWIVRMVNEVKDTPTVGTADGVSAAIDGIEKCQPEVVTY